MSLCRPERSCSVLLVLRMDRLWDFLFCLAWRAAALLPLSTGIPPFKLDATTDWKYKITKERLTKGRREQIQSSSLTAKHQDEILTTAKYCTWQLPRVNVWNDKVNECETECCSASTLNKSHWDRNWEANNHITTFSFSSRNWKLSVFNILLEEAEMFQWETSNIWKKKKRLWFHNSQKLIQ